MKQMILDIETDGINPSVVWCAVFTNVDTGEHVTLKMPNHADTQLVIDTCDVIIGHNMIGYDQPVLERLLGIDFSGVDIKDTLVMSRLLNPSLEGGHSLKAWGETLGFPKGDYNDWSQLTTEMVSYCEQDTLVTRKLYSVLIAKLKSFGTEAVDMEHKVQAIITRQSKDGWQLDKALAEDLLAGLRERQYDVIDEVLKVFIPLPTFIKVVSPKFKIDESMSTVGLKFLGDDWTQVGAEFSRIEYPEFNLGSRPQIAKHLIHYGWKPTKLTPSGKPMVDETVLKNVEGIPEASMICEYLLLQKRIAQVSSWVASVAEDGRVHGYVNSLGAITNRMTHSNPNVAQVPSSGSPYGSECRACWVVRDGYKLVGMDASGLELRMLAHYMNDEVYTTELLNGDIHTANMKAAGLFSRDQAKTFIYAFLFGAGDAKIGSIVGGTSSAGKALKKKFLENTPALADLRARVEGASKKGYMKGIDGRHIHIRSAHAALNTLLQSAGAIVMKKALVLLDEYAQLQGINYTFVGNIHDEIQTEVRADQAHKFGRLATECMVAAGQQLNFRCALAGEYKVGLSWADTH